MNDQSFPEFDGMMIGAGLSRMFNTIATHP
jgi:hypothetical protein